MVDRLALDDGLALVRVTAHADADTVSGCMLVVRLLQHHLVALNVREAGTTRLVMLLVHSYLVKLIVIQLIDLHLLYFAIRVHRWGPHGSVNAAVLAILLGHSIIAVAQTRQLIILFGCGKGC